MPPGGLSLRSKIVWASWQRYPLYGIGEQPVESARRVASIGCEDLLKWVGVALHGQESKGFQNRAVVRPASIALGDQFASHGLRQGLVAKVDKQAEHRPASLMISAGCSQTSAILTNLTSLASR